MGRVASGEFCWVELATLDKAKAQRFYIELFGWDVSEQELRTILGRTIRYASFGLGGSVGGAVYEMVQEQRDRKLGPYWLPYVAVDSADRTTQKAERMGGTCLVDPLDILDAGRISIVEDPTGASLGLWQARKVIGSEAGRMPGAPCWFELATEDVERAGAYYGALLGWTRAEGAAGRVTMAKGERPLASLRALPPGAASKPRWTTHFAVASCPASAERILAAGGTVEGAPAEVPGLGRVASVRDPQGAAFAIIEPAG